MAISVPIVSEFIDKGVKNANQAFKNLQQNVKAADTTMGKFKAVTETASGYINANFLPLVGAASGALISFGTKAVTEFQNVALAAGKLSTATGLAVDDASRYMEVLGDVGIDVGTLETAVGKLGKAAATESEGFKKLGAEIIRTDSGAVDVNETFLGVIDRLNKITDPALRAKLATELLGKGWQNMSELIGMGADELRASLASVSDAKVIDAAEVEKARDFRAAMDDLKDAVDDVTLVIGSVLVPYITDLATQTKKVMDVKVGGKSLTQYLTAIGTTAFDQINPLARLDDTMSGVARITEENSSILERGYGVMETTLSVVPVLGDAFSGLGDMIFGSTEDMRDFSGVAEQLKERIRNDVNPSLDDSRTAYDEAQRAAYKLSEEMKSQAEEYIPEITLEWDQFLDQLKRTEVFDNTREAVKKVTEELQKLYSGEVLDTAGLDDSILNAQRQIGQLVETLLATKQLTEDEANRILIKVDSKDVQGALDLITILSGVLQDPSLKSMVGGAYIPGVGTFGTKQRNIGGNLYIPGLGSFPAMANGGVVTSPTMALIGEAGPEAVVPLDRVGGIGSTINITVTSADPNEVVRAIQRWTRNNGSVPLATTTSIQR